MSVRELQNQTAFEIIRDHPLLGVGLNNSTQQLRKYSKLTYNENDANTQFYSEPINNMLIGMTTEVGVSGALLFIAFFGTAAYVAWRQSRASPDPEIRFVANALIVVFCGVAVNGITDPFDDYPPMMLLWLFAGLSLNLPRMSSAHSPMAGRNEALPG